MREVRIVQRNSTYFVMYANRRKGQRYSAAQFSIDAWTPAQIKQWLAHDRPDLKVLDD
jgi:hypothetical protein